MRRVLLFLVILAATVVQAAPFHFASLGDWGCEPVGGWHKRDELIVARQFSNATAHLGARFILNTGDNFYRCGVHSKTDEVWNSTFEHVFTHDSTMVPWWGCLGNHDYGFPGSAEAEIAYRSPNRDRWNLPARYYHRRFVYPGEVNISLVVLDSAPCQKEYRSSDPKHWDPHCVEGKMPCPGCTFHQNVMQQNCTEQFEWLKRTADTIPKGDWKIMMTHAPATGLTVEDHVGVFQEHNFDLYLNGHIHLLGHYKLDGKGTYITTGAACQVRIREGDIKQHDDDDADEKDKRSACSGKSPWHKCESVFEQTIAGYSTHAFNDDFTELSTFLYDYTGKLLHTAVSKKGDPGRR